jgi:hypothetical protein
LETSLADLPPWATKCTRPHLGCYGFLAAQPNAIVEPIHPTGMPGTLTTDEERDVWMRPLGNQIAPPGWHSTAIYHAPNGRRTMVTGTYYVVARRRKALTIRRRSNRLLATKKRPPYVGGLFVVSIGGTSPSSQSCSLANASHAASIRLYRRFRGSSVAASASRAQFSAFSRKISDCLMASSCCEGHMRRARLYNAVFGDTFSTLMNGCSGRFISLP